MMSRTEGHESGETLIELLIAFTILGILTPAMVMAMIFTTTSSKTFQDAVLPTNNVGLILDNWANAIDQATPYVACAKPFVPPSNVVQFPGPVLPEGASATIAVQYWNGTAWVPPSDPVNYSWDRVNNVWLDPGAVQACNAGTDDKGLQLVTLTVTPAPGTSGGGGIVPAQVSVKVTKRNPCLSGCT